MLYNFPIISINNWLKNVIPLLLTNPIVFLCMKYTNDKFFNVNLVYLNMLIVTFILLIDFGVNCSNKNIIYNIAQKYIYLDGTWYTPIPMILVFISWYVCYTQSIFGFVCSIFLLKLKTYVMMENFSEYTQTCPSNMNNILNVHYYNNQYTDNAPNSYNMDLTYESQIYRVIYKTYRLCTWKFWIFLVCAYLYNITADQRIMYVMTISHTLYILSVLKLHCLLYYTEYPNLNMDISYSDMFFGNIMHY